MNDYFLSLIRTIIPTTIGAVLAWAAAEWGFVLDEQSSAALTVAVMGVTVALYYGLVRALELRWPRFGKLLGASKTPRYRPPMPEAARILGARNGR